ncbi:MAG: TIM barrel protein [Saprospiraceae bacterium]|nr:TIM barrel protein [Saprospiraceae bacterium]
MKLGVGSYAFAWSIGVDGFLPDQPMTVFDFLNKAKELGAKSVQLADNFPLLSFDQQILIDIKHQATDLGLDIEIGMRGMQPEQLGRYLRIAHFFESPFLRAVIDGPNFAPSVEEVVSIIQDTLDGMRDLDVILAIENHDRLSARSFHQIIEQTDPSWVGICLDSVNSLGCGEGFGEVSRILIPHTVNVHIKDYRIERVSHNMGFNVVGTPAGQGMLPIVSLLRDLENTGRCQSATLELWPAPEDTIAATVRKEHLWAEQSMRYLHTIV